MHNGERYIIHHTSYIFHQYHFCPIFVYYYAIECRKFVVTLQTKTNLGVVDVERQQAFRWTKVERKIRKNIHSSFIITILFNRIRKISPYVYKKQNGCHLLT